MTEYKRWLPIILFSIFLYVLYNLNRFYIYKPASLPESIEIRGVGLVSVPMVNETSLDWVVNMDEAEKERMPNTRFTKIGDFRVPTVFGKDMDDLASRIYVLVSNALS